MDPDETFPFESSNFLKTFIYVNKSLNLLKQNFTLKIENSSNLRQKKNL